MTRQTIPLIVLGGWLVLLGVTGWRLQLDFRFAHGSARVIGTVLWKRETKTNSRGSNHTYDAGYTYLTPGGTLSGQHTVQAETYRSLSEGASVPILYLFSEPGRSRIDLPAENEFGTVMTYALVALSALGTLVTLLVCREYLRGSASER